MSRARAPIAATVMLALVVASTPPARSEQESHSDGSAMVVTAPSVGPRLVLRQLRDISAPVPRIVNGLRVPGLYPTVGMLAIGGFYHCTGTLIGFRTFLTAAHCVSDPVDPALRTVFLQHAGFVSVSSVTANPDFEFGVRSDIAILELAAPVTGIAPSLVNTAEQPLPGTIGDIVGFGGVGPIFGPGTSHYLNGIKRRGSVATAECVLVPGVSHLCWNFQVPVGPAGEDSNTCHGDSGGPLFADIAGLGVAVAGVTSGGNGTCLPNDTPFDADVSFDQPWIESEAGGDLAPVSCGTTPTVLGPDTQVLTDPLGGMTSEIGGVVYSFPVPADRKELRITTNGELAPAQNYDLYVKLGSQPSVDPPDFDCASTNGNSFEACSFPSPAAGTWWILVSNPSASAGEYDLTASILGHGPCPNLDVDGDGAADPLTDGVLVLRHLLSFTGDTLTPGALGAGATRDAAEIAAYIEGCGDTFDADGNGSIGALTDGVLIVRYLFGFRDAALISGEVVGTGCERCTAAAIAAHLGSLF